MARLLRRNIQDFVQEVPVGQMAQGTPFRCLLWPTPAISLGGGKGPSVQHATQGSADKGQGTLTTIKWSPLTVPQGDFALWALGMGSQSGILIYTQYIPYTKDR